MEKKHRAPGEDRTHDLQISLWSFWIMRLTRCLLRYRGRCRPGEPQSVPCWSNAHTSQNINQIISTSMFLHGILCFATKRPQNLAISKTHTQGPLRQPLVPVQQSGAVEACWAHNPEVRRSKLRSAKFFFNSSFTWVTSQMTCTHMQPWKPLGTHHVLYTSASV